jgi:predicted nucleotidyltransferase
MSKLLSKKCIVVIKILKIFYFVKNYISLNYLTKNIVFTSSSFSLSNFNDKTYKKNSNFIRLFQYVNIKEIIFNKNQTKNNTDSILVHNLIYI